MSEPTPGQPGVLIGRLAAAPTLRTTAGGERTATLRITLKGTEDYVLTAFGLLARKVLLELLVDTLTSLTPHRSHDQPT